MKKYEKPVLSVVDIQIRENLAADPFKGLVGYTGRTEDDSNASVGVKTTYTLGGLSVNS